MGHVPSNLSLASSLFFLPSTNPVSSAICTSNTDNILLLSILFDLQTIRFGCQLQQSTVTIPLHSPMGKTTLVGATAQHACSQINFNIEICRAPCCPMHVANKIPQEDMVMPRSVYLRKAFRYLSVEDFQAIDRLPAIAASARFLCYPKRELKE